MRLRPPILALVLWVVLTSCASSSEDEPTTAPGATSTTAAADTTTTAGSVVAGGPDCLVGTWVVDSDAFVESLRRVFAEEGAGAGEITGVSGSYVIELAADGSLSGERDDWGFSVVAAEGTINISMNGTETGTWAATEDTITVDIAASSIDVSATIEANGQVIDFGGSPVEVPDAIATDSAYSCEGDVLTITEQDFISVLARS